MSDYQIHQYKSGHQLIESSIVLGRQDQDVIDRLSDISGPLRPNEVFAPYFTCYPLPGQSHFVVARTWQDLGAARSGCVFTRSLLIPVDEWTKAKHIEEYFEELLTYSPPIETFNSGSNNFELTGTVREDFLFELVEALFLEERRPIAVFNAEHEGLIIIKLYNALWANIRRGFSICTLALSPRTIGNKYLDLQFSTNNSRAKFADWNGRKIEAATNNLIGPRHRWTVTIVDSIFGADGLSLKNNPNLNFGYFDKLGDESALRLALLWQELKSKAETTPTAILGLLDIANSQPVMAKELVGSLMPTIYLVLDSVEQSLDPISAWQFYLAFLGKFSNFQIDLPLLKTIKVHTDTLSANYPNQALEFLQNYNNSNQEISPILFASFANGISEGLNTHLEDSQLTTVAAKYGLHLAAASSSFARLLSVLWKRDENVRIGLRYIAASLGKKTLERSFLNLAENISEDNDLDLLNFLADYSDNQFKHKLIHTVCINTHFRSTSINNWLIKQSYRAEVLNILLVEVDEAWSETSEKKFLIDLVTNDPGLLSSLLKITNISTSDKKFVVTALLNSSEFLASNTIFTDEQIISEVLNILHPINETNVTSLINVLAYSNIPADIALDIIASVPKIAAFENCNGLYKLLNKCFLSASSKNYSQISRLLSFVPLRNFDNIFSAATAPILGNRRQTENLEVLLLNQKRFHNGLIFNIDVISGILRNSSINQLSESLLINWGLLISSSGIHFNKQNNAANIALEYAYTHPNKKTIHILVAAFPVVYQSFKNGNPFAWIPSMLFKDWDKCRTLREDLVSRYLNSGWPHSSLFIIALRSDFFEELINILSHYQVGYDFIRAARKELKEMNKSKETTFILDQLKFLK